MENSEDIAGLTIRMKDFGGSRAKTMDKARPDRIQLLCWSYYNNCTLASLGRLERGRQN